MKYVDTAITFAEVPDEISLCINFSNCPNNCPGCHSSYLKEDIGKDLGGYYGLENIILDNPGITCVCFMGGDICPADIDTLAYLTKSYQKLKTCWYSGKQELSSYIDLNNFDYIKLGPYIEEKGPLNNPNTNQRFYKVVDGELEDITYKFWNNG